MSTSGPNVTSKKPTPTSDVIGTLIAAFSKLTLFQPIDTLAANAMSGKDNLTQFRSHFSAANWRGKLRLAYSGASVEILKKLPSNGYRYPAQRIAQNYIEDSYHDKFVKLFAEHAEVAQASIAGGVSAIFEPCITQPFDAVVIHKQVYHTPILQTLRTLTIRDYYRAMGVTGVVRNLPAGVTLFGGSAYLDYLFNNEDKHSNGLNIAAKTGAGFVSVAVSQPGDVLKVQMQTNRWTLLQAMQKVSLRQLFTNGSTFRLMGGFKAGLGFFMAEKAMEASAQFFGKEVPQNEKKPSKKVTRT